MKIVLLAPANVIHTKRWAEGLAMRGVEVVVATQHPDNSWAYPAGVRVIELPHRLTSGYFLNVPSLRRLLRHERPDLLNVHYASGYGTTGAGAGFHPWLLSVWGSDVYDFPYESRFKGWWLRRNLLSADAVASTSHAMARQVRHLVPRLDDVMVTPFGVDIHLFAPRPISHEGLVIGTVKKLEPKYGVDVLLRAFALVLNAPVSNENDAQVWLEVVGGGSQLEKLKNLAVELGVNDRVRFVGSVPHADVPKWLNRFDVYVAVSRLDSESFGVAVLEASACAVPVVVSDVGGLPEVVDDGETGIVVPRENVLALAAQLRCLLADADLRQRLGTAGRARVEAVYGWQASIDRMLACYQTVIEQKRSIV